MSIVEKQLQNICMDFFTDFLFDSFFFLYLEFFDVLDNTHTGCIHEYDYQKHQKTPN